jgi:hypothetical protein
MLKIFIFVVLFLILYQFMNTIIEGLEGESSEDSSSSSGNVDNSSSNNNNCAMSLTDRNVFLLNDRVNTLQVQYTDLSGNMAILNRQLEDLMKQNENAATEMVGNEPLDISTGGNDMPQEISGDIGEGGEGQQEQETTTPL